MEIKTEIYDYDYPSLVTYLRKEAGVSNKDYFMGDFAGGLLLQQVPEEYAGLLQYFKSKKFKSYLELGIGDGGSFLMNCFFQKASLKKANAVDNWAYNQKQKQVEQVLDDIMRYVFVNSKGETGLYPCTTDQFFQHNRSNRGEKSTFDCIFIDADHSYECAKRDFINALTVLNPGGTIIFHDINSQACPGIVKLWEEVKIHPYVSNFKEFIHSKTCGIGLVEIKEDANGK